MQPRRHPVRDFRSLPPHPRAEALRQLLRKRLPQVPRAVVQFSSCKPVGAPGGGRRSRHGKGIHLLMFAAGLLAAVALARAPVRGVSAGTLGLDITPNAIHTEASAWRTLNQCNPVVRVEYHFAPTRGAMAREYLNSYR